MDSFDAQRRRELRAGPPPGERRAPREGEALEQRLDRWMEAGRQLVEGVSGGRPGSRPAGRRPEGRPIARRGIDGLGRWVEERLDWLIDDGDDWREPWQEGEVNPRPAAPPAFAGPAPRSSRRPLEARSRRGASDRTSDSPGPLGPQRRSPQAADPAARALDPDRAGGDNDGDWPTDEAFVVPRWRRSAPPSSSAMSPAASPRPLAPAFPGTASPLAVQPASLAPGGQRRKSPVPAPAAERWSQPTASVQPTTPAQPAAAAPSAPAADRWSQPTTSLPPTAPPPAAQRDRRAASPDRHESAVERSDPAARPLPRSSRRR